MRRTRWWCSLFKVEKKRCLPSSSTLESTRQAPFGDIFTIMPKHDAGRSSPLLLSCNLTPTLYSASTRDSLGEKNFMSFLCRTDLYSYPIVTVLLPIEVICFWEGQLSSWKNSSAYYSGGILANFRENQIHFTVCYISAILQDLWLACEVIFSVRGSYGIRSHGAASNWVFLILILIQSMFQQEKISIGKPHL